MVAHVEYNKQTSYQVWVHVGPELDVSHAPRGTPKPCYGNVLWACETLQLIGIFEQFESLT